jgi:outer membrane immunogenic protein
MRKLVLSSVAIAAVFAQPSFAADLAPAPVYRAAPLTPVFMWSGCYVGAEVGGGMAWTQSTNLVNSTAFGDFTPGQGFANPASGVIGGGHVGCNYQYARMVLGIEVSYDGADISRDYASPFGGADDVYRTRINGVATVAGRFGWAFDSWLFYTKLGWAGAHASLSVVDNVPPAVGAGSASNWHNGATIGTGTEVAIDRNWIVGFESNYYRFESKTYELGGGAALYTFRTRPRDVFSYLARVSWKFN